MKLKIKFTIIYKHIVNCIVKLTLYIFFFAFSYFIFTIHFFFTMYTTSYDLSNFIYSSNVTHKPELFIEHTVNNLCGIIKNDETNEIKMLKIYYKYFSI